MGQALIILTVAMLFISSDYFHMIATKIMIPVIVLPYILCSFVYYKLGAGRYSTKSSHEPATITKQTDKKRNS